MQTRSILPNVKHPKLVRDKMTQSKPPSLFIKLNNVPKMDIPVSTHRNSNNFEEKNTPFQSILQMKLNKNLRSTSEQPSNFCPLNESEYVLNIRLISNWGHPNVVTCSEIDILGKDRQPIHNCHITYSKKIVSKLIKNMIIRSSFEIERNNYNNDLSKLCNNTLIKSSLQDSWSTKWVFNEDLELTIRFSSENPPEYIRIWNGKSFPEANVRRFSVYSANDNKFLCEGEVPQVFGTVIQFNKNNMPIVNQISRNFFGSKNCILKQPKCEDIFGEQYIPLAKELKITLVEPFNPEYGQIGLNCVQIFGIDGEPIGFSKIKTINIISGASITSPFKLFKSQRITMKAEDMWIGSWSDLNGPPILKISFNEPTKIVMIRIWNYNGYEDSDKAGAKKVQIESDLKFLWRGVLNKGLGMITRIKDGTKDIWLTEPKQFINLPGIQFEEQ